MKRKEREGIKAANGIGPGAKLSVRQVVIARLMKKLKEQREHGRRTK